MMLGKYLKSLECGLSQEGRQHKKELSDQLSITNMLLGKLLSAEFINIGKLSSIQDAEYRVFSQWGDDGIIQYLVNLLDIKEKSFIEFGVSNYLESNTRFLLMNNNWSGLVIDGSDNNIEFIRNDDIYWRHDLTAISAFVSAENINELISKAGFNREIGLLHIDIDGNDYWVWKAIDIVKPVIVVIEYNSLFGSERAITIPYEPKFCRFDAHHSGIYAGASLPALCGLAEEKGYEFIGSNSAGNNAYFVRRDCLGELKPLSPKQGYVASKFREYRDTQGGLTFLSGRVAIENIRGLKVFNTRTNELEEL